MDARPCLQPCHATQTLPVESVAATGNTSEPASFEIWISPPGFPFSMERIRKDFVDVPEEETRMMVHDNAARLYDLI